VADVLKDGIGAMGADTRCAAARSDGGTHQSWEERVEVVEPASHTLLVDRRDRHRAVEVTDPMAVWIDAAIKRGQQVLYELEPAESRDTVLSSLPVRDAAEQFVVLDPATVRAESHGTADGLAQMHRSRVDQAHAQGWSGLALITGPAVFGAVVGAVVDGNAVPDATDLTSLHDHGVSRVVVEAGMSALCRYQPVHQPELAGAMLGGHFPHVEDEIWGARVIDGRLHLHGEVDVSNDKRLAHVLRGALAAGVRILDVSDLRFCAVAGARALVGATAWLPEGETLVIANADTMVLQVLSVAGLSRCSSLELRDERR
jgi:anti-anti-sigma factor